MRPAAGWGGHFPLILQPWAASPPFVWGRAELIEGSDPSLEVAGAEEGRSSLRVRNWADCPSPGDKKVLDISFLHIEAPSFPSSAKNAGSLPSQREPASGAPSPCPCGGVISPSGCQ